MKTVRIQIMTTITPNHRGRYNNLSEEKLEAELNKVNPDVKVILQRYVYKVGPAYHHVLFHCRKIKLCC